MKTLPECPFCQSGMFAGGGGFHMWLPEGDYSCRSCQSIFWRFGNPMSDVLGGMELEMVGGRKNKEGRKW